MMPLDLAVCCAAVLLAAVQFPRTDMLWVRQNSPLCSGVVGTLLGREPVRRRARA